MPTPKKTKKINLNDVPATDLTPNLPYKENYTLISVEKNNLLFFAFVPGYRVDEYLVGIDKTSKITTRPIKVGNIQGKYGSFIEDFYPNNY